MLLCLCGFFELVCSGGFRLFMVSCVAVLCISVNFVKHNTNIMFVLYPPQATSAWGVRHGANWVALLVQRYLSNAASSVLFVLFVLFVVSRIILSCDIIRHF